MPEYQETLPILDQSEKFAALRRAVDALPEEYARKRHRLYTLIEQIIVHTGKGRCHWPVETLAHWCRCSTRTLYEYLALARDLGWLVTTRDGPGFCDYHLQWQAIVAADRPAKTADRSAKTAGRPAKTADRPAKTAGRPAKTADRPAKTAGPIDSRSELVQEVQRESEAEDSLSNDFSEEDPDLQLAVADRMGKPVNAAAVQTATRRIAAAGFTAADVRAVKLPRWWSEPPHAEQLLDELTAGREKAAAAEASRREKHFSAMRIRDQAEREKARIAEEKARIDAARPLWDSLPEAERRRRIDSLGTFVAADLREETALAAFAAELTIDEERGVLRD